MERDIRDFLIPIFGPLNAFYKTNRDSKQNLQKVISREISDKEFRRTELMNTSYVLLSGATSTFGLCYVVYDIWNMLNKI